MLRNRRGGIQSRSPFKQDDIKVDMPDVKVTPKMEKIRNLKNVGNQGFRAGVTEATSEAITNLAYNKTVSPKKRFTKTTGPIKRFTKTKK